MDKPFREKLSRFLQDTHLASLSVSNPNGADYCVYCSGSAKPCVVMGGSFLMVDHDDDCINNIALTLLNELENQD
jgi:hypothetical protein